MAYAHVRVGGEGGSLLLLPKSLPLFSPLPLRVLSYSSWDPKNLFFGKGGAGKEEEGRRKDVRETDPSQASCVLSRSSSGRVRDSTKPVTQCAWQKGERILFFHFSRVCSSNKPWANFTPSRIPSREASSSSSLSCSEGPNKSSSSLLPSPPL